MKTSNRVLTVLGLFLLAFIITMIAVFCVKGSVPDTLIQYTLGAGGVEALVLAGIKISKVIAGEDRNPPATFGGPPPFNKGGLEEDNLLVESEDNNE